ARSAIRWALRAPASSAPPRSSCDGAAGATASPPSAVVWARAPRPSSKRCRTRAVEFFAVVETQRALRRFRPQPVSTRDVRRILDAATRAPSARGAEPWVFVVVRDAGLRAEIGRRYHAAWDQGERFTQATDADRDVRDHPHYA